MLSVTTVIYHVQWCIEHRSYWFFSLPHQMLPHPELTSNHLLCRPQLKIGQLSPTLGGTKPSILHLILHHGFCNNPITFLNSIYSCLLLCRSLGPINWTCQTKSNISWTSEGKLLFTQSSSKEEYSFPQCQDHSFSNSLFNTILKHVSYQWSTPCMRRWRLVTSPSSKVTQTWMQ